MSELFDWTDAVARKQVGLRLCNVLDGMLGKFHDRVDADPIAWFQFMLAVIVSALFLHDDIFCWSLD